MRSDPRLYDYLRRLESASVDESPELAEVASIEAMPRANRSSSGLTIFIPNWNYESVLPRALNSAFEAVSALQSEGFSGEILVVDDGSRDGSVKLLRTIQAIYGREDLRVVSLRKNYGQARVTNLALQIASHRYVLRLDSDNQLVPQNVATFLRSSIETEASLLYGNVIKLAQDEDEVERADKVEGEGLWSNMPATLHLTDRNYIDALCIMDAFDLLELGGYTRVNPYSPEDWEMNLHLVAHENLIVFVPLAIGYYHVGPQSASNELSLTDPGAKTIRRIYAQAGPRSWDKKRVGRIYYPQVGFLDEWDYGE
jgi:glycosyltransferase involved in cell wall biosynthesis